MILYSRNEEFVSSLHDVNSEAADIPPPQKKKLKAIDSCKLCHEVLCHVRAVFRGSVWRTG